MSKKGRNRKRAGRSQKPFRVKMRKHEPKYLKEGDKVILMCPFCEPPHAIIAGQTAACGSKLEVTVVQPMYITRAVTCVKCGEAGGTMVKIGDAYCHDHDCAPGKRVFTEMPRWSGSAKFVYGLPLWMQRIIRARSKRNAERVVKLDEDNNPTDHVEGYYWRPLYD